MRSTIIAMTWAVDLDGVVWRGEVKLPGADAAIARLRAAGQRVVFLTNNSSPPVSHTVAKLARMGVVVEADDVVTSAQAAASLLAPGTTVLVCGGPGVVEAVEAAGAVPVVRGPADAVVVGWHREFDYSRLTEATTAVLGGARLVATNDDPTYPTEAGLVPGGGALVAAVAYASGVAAEVAGKPNEAMVALVAARIGPVAVMVGDRPDTDGALARRLGARFALVLSGVTTAADLPLDPPPDLLAPDLATLVAAELAG